MKTFFVEESRSNVGFKKFYKKIEKTDNKIIINCSLKRMSIKKKEKIAKKIKGILLNEKCRQIVIQEKLKDDVELINLLYSLDINICNEKWLFKKCTRKIINQILATINDEVNISICVNNLEEIGEELIFSFAKEFKMVNIITNYIGKFKKIEKKLFEEEGIIINITNNKKKSMAKSKIILNIDFPKEIINRFTIYDEAIIVSWEDDIKINKKRFNGKIIDKVNWIFDENNEIMDYVKQYKLEGYNLADICQMLDIVPLEVLPQNNNLIPGNIKL